MIGSRALGAQLLAACSAACLLACGSGPDPSGGSGGSDEGSDGGAWGTASASAVGAVGAGGAPSTTTTTTSTGGAAQGTSTSSGSGAGGEPAFGGSSNGAGGPAPVDGATQQAGGITYRLIVPASYSGAPTPLLVVFSGVEGGQTMTNNLMQVESYTSTDGFIRAVLDGKTYNGNGVAGATVLDDLRSKYNVDNDRTYLLGESAGTTAALELGFQLEQSYFAAYWANDVNATASPAATSAALGFQPWGQVGPGGQFAIADQIVSGMEGAGYRLPNPAPYAGAGAGTHGDAQQFIAAMSWFAGKTRK